MQYKSLVHKTKNWIRPFLEVSKQMWMALKAKSICERGTTLPKPSSFTQFCSLSKNSALDVCECALLPNSPLEAPPTANTFTCSLGIFYKSNKINLPIGFQYVGAFLFNSFHFFLQGNNPIVCNCKLLIKLEK